MKKKNIILLQPRVGDMDDFRDRPTPPMSLIQASQFIINDFEVILVDQRIDRNWRKHLLELLSRNPILIGITTLSGSMVGSALEMAKFVKEHSKAPIVWGGIHVTLLPEQTIKSKYVDFVITGEGEYAFRDLANAIDKGEKSYDIPGLWYKIDNKIINNPRGKPLDYDSLHLPPYELVNMNDYMYKHRGCPYHCVYCYNKVFFNNKWSSKSAEKVLKNIDTLRDRYDFDAVYFLDDNFFINRKRAWKILEGMKKRGLLYELQGVDIQTIYSFNENNIKMLEDTGLLKMTIGVESANNRIRKLIGKWGTIEQTNKSLIKLANRKFLVLTSFIIGFPFETWEEISQTIQYALQLQQTGNNFRFPQFYNFTPIPSTPIAEWMEKTGYQFPKIIDDWSKIDWDHNSIFYDNPDKIKKLETIAFLSKFIDRKNEDYGTRLLVSTLYRIYRPIAEIRLKKGFYNFIIEKKLYDLLKKLIKII